MLKQLLIIISIVGISFAQIQHEGTPKYFDSQMDVVNFINIDKTNRVDRNFHPMVFQFGNEYDVDINFLISIANCLGLSICVKTLEATIVSGFEYSLEIFLITLTLKKSIIVFNPFLLAILPTLIEGSTPIAFIPNFLYVGRFPSTFPRNLEPITIFASLF